MKKITINDKLYPSKLRKIKNPPKSLFLLGNVNLLNENSISIIGSRACSENGKNLARKFSRELASQGLTIVSGMAKGIDKQAHIGTLSVNGNTIAVLGSGFDNIFPKENISLFHKILDNNGLIISEYPPNVKPDSKKFLERNRIVSGLSLGVLIIEAAYRSGTSVTARLAYEQGRKVFVLPHEISDIHGVGTNTLIKKGANLVTSTYDIFSYFNFLEYKENLIPPKEDDKELNSKSKRSDSDNDKMLNSNSKIKDSSKNSNMIFKKIDFDNSEQKIVYDYIKNSKQSVTLNDIALGTNLSINKISECLLILELNKYILNLGGLYVIL